MTTALITGVSGFIGAALRKKLGAQGVSVFGVDRSVGAQGSSADFFCGDVGDRKFVQEIFQETRPDIVFHLAGAKARDGRLEAYRAAIEGNLGTTLNVSEACLATESVRCLITMGTCEEYGSSTVPFHEGLREAPVSAYSFSKATATQLLQTLYRTHRLPAVVLRPSLVYGPGQQPDMFLPALIQALLREETFPMSAGQQTRDFVYIDDMVVAMIKAAWQPNALGKAINIACGTPTVLRDIALQVARIIGNDCESLIRFGEVRYRLAEIMEYVASPKLANSVLNWAPSTSLEEGLSQTIDYYRSRIAMTRPT